MIRRINARRTLGAIITAVGCALLLATCTWFIRKDQQGQELRAQLEQTPAAATAAPAATTALAATVEPSATAIPPSATAVLAATAAPAATTAPVTTATPAPVATPAVIATRPLLPTPTGAPPSLPMRITIPDLKLDATVQEMGWTVVNTATGPQSDWVIPKNASGHHINSTALNQLGNLVISGHNNIDGKVFEPISLAWDDKTRVAVDDLTDRSEILTGRTIRLFDAAGKAFDYKITDFYRVKDSGVTQAQRVQNARFMDPSDDYRITLLTCWPPWSNTHRLVVVGKLTQP